MQEAPAKLAQASTETLLFKPQAAPVVVPDLRMEVFAPAMALVPMAGNTVYLQTLTGMPVTTSQPIPLIGPLIISNSVQVRWQWLRDMLYVSRDSNLLHIACGECLNAKRGHAIVQGHAMG